MPPTKWLKQPHLRQFIAEGVVKLMPNQVSLSFWHHIEKNYPLMQLTEDSIDWRAVNNAIRILWTQATDEEVLHFVRSTRLGGYDKVVAYYTQWDPSLLGSLPFIVNNLELLYRTAHHAVYLFGVEEMQNEVYRYSFDDFIELDLDDEMWLSGIKRVS